MKSQEQTERESRELIAKHEAGLERILVEIRAERESGRIAILACLHLGKDGELHQA